MSGQQVLLCAGIARRVLRANQSEGGSRSGRWHTESPKRHLHMRRAHIPHPSIHIPTPYIQYTSAYAQSHEPHAPTHKSTVAQGLPPEAPRQFSKHAAP
jgi:hypothetical protein